MQAPQGGWASRRRMASRGARCTLSPRSVETSRSTARGDRLVDTSYSVVVYYDVVQCMYALSEECGDEPLDSTR